MDKTKSLSKLYKMLVPLINGDLYLDEPMFKHTTFRVGGPAAIYVNAKNLADLKLLLEVIHEKNLNFLVIGKGANLLFSDQGYNGVIIKLGRDFNNVKVSAEEGEIHAGAAVPLARVIQEAFAHSLAGLEFAASIPATVGGAVSSNAGAFGKSIGETVSKIILMSKDGLRQKETPFNLSYRKGVILREEIVVEVIFKLEKGEKMLIKAKAESYFKKRKKSQPLNYPSAGSIFKNPSAKVSAGKLIEECGLKGMIEGDAMISDKHANFIVNRGCARASDIFRLIQKARKQVKEKFDIMLEPEIKIIGEFDE